MNGDERRAGEIVSSRCTNGAPGFSLVEFQNPDFKKIKIKKQDEENNVLKVFFCSFCTWFDVVNVDSLEKATLTFCGGRSACTWSTGLTMDTIRTSKASIYVRKSSTRPWF